jgi:uroporphyrinogen decarboxylase
MNSRERVLTALNHEEPDKIPVDFGGFRSSGIQAIAYNKLKKHLGITKNPAKLYDLMQQLAEPELEVLERFGADVVQLHMLKPSFDIKIDRWKESVLPDGSPTLVPEDFNPIKKDDGTWVLLDEEGEEAIKMPSDGLYFEGIRPPFRNAETEKDIDDFNWGVMGDEDVEFLKKQGKFYRENTDYAVLGCFGGNIFENGHVMWGYENFMLQLAMNPELVRYFLEKLTENHIDNLKKYLPAVEGNIDVIAVGDDLGTQSGLQISSKMYREMIKPYHARVYQFIRENSSARLFLHSCGAIDELLPDLIEIGVEIINPVQISAAGMEPEKLKRKYGKNLTFWGGGCETQNILPNGTIDDIRRNVRELVSIFKPGGGFVFTQVHNILANIPPEKIVAVYDTASEIRDY